MHIHIIVIVYFYYADTDSDIKKDLDNSPDTTNNKIGNLDGDGEITSSDSLAILRYSVGFRDNGILIK